MLEIAIITFSRTKNYGGILQAYALYDYLVKQGHSVVFIDYIMARSNVYDKRVFADSATGRSRIWGENGLTKYIWTLLMYPKIRNDYLKFSHFIEKRAKFTKQYFSYEELAADPPQAQLYITGSDQVWNSQFCKDEDLDLPFYLGFIPERKKISYASSFGKDFIPQKNEDIVKKYLERYSYLSVRELSGQKILSGLGLKSEVVVDPTLLCDRAVWDTLCDQKKINKKYVLLYQVKHNSKICQIARETAKKLRLELITITPNRNERRKIAGKVVVTPDVEVWLSYIKNAELIITDSFHATIFSIIFQKKFVVNTATRKGMSTRISNLLAMLNLSEREMTEFDTDVAFDLANSEIKWQKVELLLEEKQNKSRIWLKNAIDYDRDII